MRRLPGIVILLVLAGCASGDWFHQDEPVKPAPPTTEVVPQASPQVAPRAIPNNLSPAATAAAPKTDAAESRSDGLLDCVTESCKINCSPKVKKQFQPKWCVNFKEPIE
jgi:hypothetical protein